MKEEAVRKIIELGRNHDNVFRLVTKMKIESADVAGGRSMRGNDGTLYLNEKNRANCSRHICQRYSMKRMNGIKL